MVPKISFLGFFCRRKERSEDEAHLSAPQRTQEADPRIPQADGDACGEGHPFPTPSERAQTPVRDDQREEVTDPGRTGGTRGGGESGFPRGERMRTDREYREVVRKGERASTDHFVVYRDFRGGDTRKIGISVGKRAGSAVVRNRIKRVLREYYRFHKVDFPEGSRTAIVVKKPLPDQGLETVVSELHPAILRRWGGKEEGASCRPGTSSSGR